MNCVVVGASAGLGRALAEELAGRGNNLLLTASSEDDLKALATHLRIKYDTQVDYLPLDFSQTESSAHSLYERAAKLGEIDTVLFPIGLSRDDDTGSLDPAASLSLLNVNLASSIAVSSLFLADFLKRNKGSLVYFGSVAAERGRGSNIVYAAAKRGLNSYVESLRHLTGSSKLNIKLYQVGFMETSLTVGKKLAFPAVKPAELAAYVVNNLNSGAAKVFYPGFWALVCLILNLVPWPIYKKMKF